MLTIGRTAIESRAAAAIRGIVRGGPEVPSAEANSLAVAKRAAGSFSSARAIADSRAGGTPDTTDESRGAGAVMCWLATESVVGPVKGWRPLTISNTTHPRLYTSLRPSSLGSPSACSGLMYAAVPSVVPS